MEINLNSVSKTQDNGQCACIIAICFVLICTSTYSHLPYSYEIQHNLHNLSNGLTKTHLKLPHGEKNTNAVFYI